MMTDEEFAAELRNRLGPRFVIGIANSEDFVSASLLAGNIPFMRSEKQAYGVALLSLLYLLQHKGADATQEVIDRAIRCNKAGGIVT
jgi:hypothetical protein